MKVLFCFVFFQFLFSLNANAQQYRIDSVCFNTPFDDYGIRIIGNHIVLVSTFIKDIENESLVDANSLDPFSNIFSVRDCKIEEYKLASDNNEESGINSAFNDGPVSMDINNKLFFTTKNSGNSKNTLGIYYCIKNNGKWSEFIPFPLNSNKYNVTHPYFDSDSKRLYFTSNMEKKKNDYDIFYSSFNGEKWSEAVSVQKINSDSMECFPYVYNGRLFFSSNNNKSKGGLDLFELMNDQVINLGEPFNSKFHDFSLYYVNDTMGYFSSNRSDKGPKDDDVYAFSLEQIKENTMKQVPVEEVVISKEEPKKMSKPTFKMRNITFGFDRFDIDKLHQNYLNHLAEYLNKQTEYSILIISHTDNKGVEIYNKHLSMQRAQAVKNYLESKGVSTDRMKIECKGSADPTTSNKTHRGRALNRRVEIEFLGI